MQPAFVRDARTTDAHAIAQLHWDVMHGPYRQLLPSEIVDNLDFTWMETRWQEAIETPPDHYSRVYVAVDRTAPPGSDQPDSETIVGFAAVTLPEPDSGVPNFQQSAFLEPLMVAQEHRRKGHGSRLLAAAVDNWREGKVRYGYTMVLDGDTYTENFLRDTGWAPDGTEYRHSSPETEVVQRRWHTDLGTDDSPAQADERPED